MKIVDGGLFGLVSAFDVICTGGTFCAVVPTGLLFCGDNWLSLCVLINFAVTGKFGKFCDGCLVRDAIGGWTGFGNILNDDL